MTRVQMPRNPDTARIRSIVNDNWDALGAEST